jgi:hypothetical protein
VRTILPGFKDQKLETLKARKPSKKQIMDPDPGVWKFANIYKQNLVFCLSEGFCTFLGTGMFY